MRIALKITPGARRNELLGWEDNYPQVGRICKIKIAAPPVEGKANKEIITYLAAVLGLPKSAITLLHGTGSRLKLIEIPDGTSLAPLDVPSAPPSAP